MNSSAILCLGEPLFELNQAADGRFCPGFGGDVSNVAVAIARQGGTAGLISQIGDDRFGAELRRMWDAEGVDTTHVGCPEGGETGIYFVTHDEAGHHFTYRRKGSAASRLGTDALPVKAIAAASILYTSGISLAVSETLRATTIAAMDMARRSDTAVAFDPNLRTRLWPLETAREVSHDVMRRCDIALPGLDDARQLTGLTDPPEIVTFYHDLGAKIVALTLGAGGVLISTGGEVRHIPPRRVNAVDATGAGDCFNGIFLTHLLRSQDPFEAARIANTGAALSTTGYGAVAPIPTYSEIQQAEET
jgi:2-dehydro-3-deoxygluconokinase